MAGFDRAFSSSSAKGDVHLQTDTSAGYFDTPYEHTAGTATALRATIRMSAAKSDPKWGPACQIFLYSTDHAPKAAETEDLDSFSVRLVNPVGQTSGPSFVVVEEWSGKTPIGGQTIKDEIKLDTPLDVGIYWGKPGIVTVAIHGTNPFNFAYQPKVSFVAINNSTAVCNFDSIQLGTLATGS